MLGVLLTAFSLKCSSENGAQLYQVLSHMLPNAVKGSRGRVAAAGLHLVGLYMT